MVRVSSPAGHVCVELIVNFVSVVVLCQYSVLPFIMGRRHIHCV